MILDQFPLIYWINLKRSVTRRRSMANTLTSMQMVHRRFEAVDGREVHLYGTPHPTLSDAESACTFSHLLLLRQFLTTNRQEVIVFEDDVSFQFLQYIPYNWSQFRASLPPFQAIQLAVTTNYQTSVPCRLTPFDPALYYCSAAYLITRSGAEQILTTYDAAENLDLSKYERGEADKVLFSSIKTYTIPFITYTTTDSTIHRDHLHIQKLSKHQQLLAWQQYQHTDLNWGLPITDKPSNGLPELPNFYDEPVHHHSDNCACGRAKVYDPPEAIVDFGTLPFDSVDPMPSSQ